MAQPYASTPTNQLFQFALCITWVFGASMVLFPDLAVQFFGLMIYQDMGAMLNWPADAQQYVKLAHAVMGSVIMGWSVLMLWVGRTATQQNTQTAVRAIGLSILVWYVPDTLASLFHGFWQNAIFNTGFLLMLMLTLYLYGKPSTRDADRAR